jgi:hypothetical protein
MNYINNSRDKSVMIMTFIAGNVAATGCGGLRCVTIQDRC